ncbi:transporter DctQ-related protein [Desulfosarcina widdelii]|uniref:Transporter DctQ-related protein n=1 Tax=Desulfosarcina widdelii TaxID=947919 RepID=A0A5K7YWD6_9BACT|nr:TRAP transporter small permease subunit [Desulfosarcina widdelii]BBO72640.1 transporter DctQ-related protein [Desulfosarcina widdelii]
MNILNLFADKVDALNDWIGRMVAYLIIPLTLVVVLEVILRYFFSSPTIWAWDVNMYLGGLMVIFGGGYALHYDMHVSVEILLDSWNPKNRALLNMILSPFIIVPLGILVWFGAEAAWHSVKIGERYTSLWEPIIYPLRICIPLGAALFFFQAISKLIKNVNAYLVCRKD